MRDELILSDIAQQLEKALISIPPQYGEADEILAKQAIAPEELAKIATGLMNECFGEQLPYRESLQDLVDENTYCSHIYKVMQYLFSKGYDPNIVVDDDCAMNNIMFLNYPESLAPKLMRLFLEHGADPNLVVGREGVFEYIDYSLSVDRYMERSVVYCWLVLMAYGARLGKELPITMYDGFDVTIFKRFEDYSYYEITPSEQIGNWFGRWKMRIYETKIGEPARPVAELNIHWSS